MSRHDRRREAALARKKYKPSAKEQAWLSSLYQKEEGTVKPMFSKRNRKLSLIDLSKRKDAEAGKVD